MPRCEDLPYGPCSKNVNNNSVKLTQGDLMLCPSYDAICFSPNVTEKVTAVQHDDGTNIETDNSVKLNP